MLASPTTGAAQSVTGEATAVRATVFSLLGSTTTTLASTGTLSGTTDAREASMNTGEVPSLLGAETLHATTIGWPDQTASEASVAALALRVAGTTIGADFVGARALAASAGEEFGTSAIGNLSVNGVPVDITGDPNQAIAISRRLRLRVWFRPDRRFRLNYFGRTFALQLIFLCHNTVVACICTIHLLHQWVLL